MKIFTKEVGIIPGLFIVLAAGVGSIAIVNCNDDELCRDLGGDCSDASAGCCEGFVCGEAGRCCVPTGASLTEGATAADCCSGQAKVTLASDPSDPFSRADVCCATAGQTASSGECCEGLSLHLGTCYACIETGEAAAPDIPCCDARALVIGGRCAACSCGWTYPPPGHTQVGEGPVCNCPPIIDIAITDPEDILPGECLDCPGHFPVGDCRQAVVMTEGYCDPQPGDPDPECFLITVTASTDESLRACAASRAIRAGFELDNMKMRPLTETEFIEPSLPNADELICADICGR